MSISGICACDTSEYIRERRRIDMAAGRPTESGDTVATQAAGGLQSKPSAAVASGASNGTAASEVATKIKMDLTSISPVGPSSHATSLSAAHKAYAQDQDSL